MESGRVRIYGEGKGPRNAAVALDNNCPFDDWTRGEAKRLGLDVKA